MRIERVVVGDILENTYLLQRESTRETVIIDPGEETERILNRLSEMEAKPVAILLTHGHWDHIYSVPALREQFRIPVIAASQEAALLEDVDANRSWRLGAEHHLTVRPDRLLEDKERFMMAGLEMEMLLTPGHTAGSACYYMEKQGILFSGDTLFCKDVGRTDLPTGSEEALIASIQQKLFTLPDQVKVLPGHMGYTTIGKEKRDNPYVAPLPETGGKRE